MKRKSFLILFFFLLFSFSLIFGQEDSFFTEEAEEASGGARVGVSGEVSLQTRITPDTEDLKRSTVEAIPGLNLGVDFNAKNSEIKANLEFRQSESFEDLESMIDEAYLRLYWDRLDLQAGYLKLVWGKGDDLHVIDTLNPLDYSEFILPDYIDQKTAEKMIRLNLIVGLQSRWEFVYLPVFTPNNIPDEGTWAPRESAELNDAVEQALESWIAAQVLAGTDQLAATLAAQALASEIIQEENTRTLAHSQYASRFTTSIGRFDLGASYLYGFIREPSVDTSGLVDLSDLRVEIDYDRVHQFGLEGSTAVGAFTFRTELGYFMTEDFKGDDEKVHNHEVAYLYGADWDLPVSNLRAAVQGIGRIILKNSEIDPGDIQYDEDDTYTQNIVTFQVSDKYRYEKIEPELVLLWDIERSGWMLKPSLELALRDEAKVNISYFAFWGDEKSYFGQFDDNDLLEVTFTYSF